MSSRHGQHADHRGDHRHDDGHDKAFESAAVVALLELEGEVFAQFTALAVGRLQPSLDAAGVVVTRVVDLGCGPGVAACDLATLFDSASVIAADSSPAMLERAMAGAARLGLAAQVEARPIDLDGDLRSLGTCDVVFASMSLHHVHDEIATLGRVRSLLEPTGLLCVLERADPPVLRLAEEGGRPGLWTRLELAWQRWFDDMRGRLPGATKADMYPSMLRAAGFEIVVDETIEIDVDVYGSAAARSFAARLLQRTGTDLAPYADAADLEVLPRLAHAMSASNDDASRGAIHATRKLFIATPA